MSDQRPVQELEQALDACVTAIGTGLTAEQALDAYPHLRPELEPLLGVATDLRSTAQSVAPSAAFRVGARQRLMARANASTQSPRPRLFGVWFLPRSIGRLPSTIAAGFLALLLFGGVTVNASAAALPGDPLYPVKRLAEQAELALATNEEARHGVRLRILEERFSEAVALGQRGAVERADEAVSSYSAAVEQLESETSDDRAADLALQLVQHRMRLAEILETLPEPARPAIERAIEVSSRALERRPSDLPPDALDKAVPAKPRADPPGPSEKRPADPFQDKGSAPKPEKAAPAVKEQPDDPPVGEPETPDGREIVPPKGAGPPSENQRQAKPGGKEPAKPERKPDQGEGRPLGPQTKPSPKGDPS